MAKGTSQFWERMKKKEPVPRTPLSTAQVWLLILSGCAMLGVALIGWSTYLFFAVSVENLFTPVNEEEGAVLTIDRSELTDVLEFIAVRASRFEILQTAPPNTVAPER